MLISVATARVAGVRRASKASSVNELVAALADDSVDHILLAGRTAELLESDSAEVCATEAWSLCLGRAVTITQVGDGASDAVIVDPIGASDAVIVDPIVNEPHAWSDLLKKLRTPEARRRFAYGAEQLGRDLDGEAAGDYFGWSVAMSHDGMRLAVGAIYNANNLHPARKGGHVRVYEWVSEQWEQLGGDIDGEAAEDHSGVSVSLSADGALVAIGAYANDGSAFAAGHVRVYEWTEGRAWQQRGGDIDGVAENDYSGRSVALSGDGARLAIGAHYHSGDNGRRSGHARVFEYDGTVWQPMGDDVDGEAAGDQSGKSVALNDDGSRLAVGAPHNGANGHAAGHVRVYAWASARWVQMGGDIDGEAASDQSGKSVALSGDGSRLAVGAPYNDGNGADSGHARVYEYDGAAWQKLGGDLDGEAAGDLSGWSVSLSADGSRLAVGAPYNDDGKQLDGTPTTADCANGHGGAGDDECEAWAAAGECEANPGFMRKACARTCGSCGHSGVRKSGHARVFGWSGKAWARLAADVDGEAAGDWSGHALALSGDGARLAIGAYYNDGANGTDSGHARVHALAARRTVAGLLGALGAGEARVVLPAGTCLGRAEAAEEASNDDDKEAVGGAARPSEPTPTPAPEPSATPAPGPTAEATPTAGPPSRAEERRATGVGVKEVVGALFGLVGFFGALLVLRISREGTAAASQDALEEEQPKEANPKAAAPKEEEEPKAAPRETRRRRTAKAT